MAGHKLEHFFTVIQRKGIVLERRVHGGLACPPAHGLRIAYQKEEIAEYLLISTCATGEDAIFAHGYFYRLIKPNFLDFCLDFVFSVLLGARKAHLAYCPSSNMFLADGVTDLPRTMRSGVNVALGSDGACSNNRISVFEETRMATLLQKVATHNAACVHHRDVLNGYAKRR